MSYIPQPGEVSTNQQNQQPPNYAGGNPSVRTAGQQQGQRQQPPYYQPNQNVSQEVMKRTCCCEVKTALYILYGINLCVGITGFGLIVNTLTDTDPDPKQPMLYDSLNKEAQIAIMVIICIGIALSCVILFAVANMLKQVVGWCHLACCVMFVIYAIIQSVFGASSALTTQLGVGIVVSLHIGYVSLVVYHFLF